MFIAFDAALRTKGASGRRAGLPIDAGRRESVPALPVAWWGLLYRVGFKFEALPCQPNTFHHIPNLTSPLGLDSGLVAHPLLRRGRSFFCLS